MLKRATTLKQSLLLLLLALLCFVSTALGAGNGPNNKQPPKQMTDAAGRVHVRSMNRITEAQRKAAARQRKANRQKAARTRLQNKTGEVK
jgi:hypothetical protein